MDSITKILKALGSITATDQVERAVSDFEDLGKRFRGWQDENIPGAKAANRFVDSYVNPAIDAASMAGFPGPSFGVFIGPKSARWGEIAVDKKYLDPFGFRKAEISDEASRLNIRPLEDMALLSHDPRTPTSVKVSDVLQHDDLFSHYPELANNKITMLPEGSGAGGMYDKAAKTVYLSPEAVIKAPQQIKGTLLHELNHGVQAIEGFPYGISVGAFRFARDARAEALRAAARRSKDPAFAKIQEDVVDMINNLYKGSNKDAQWYLDSIGESESFLTTHGADFNPRMHYHPDHPETFPLYSPKRLGENLRGSRATRNAFVGASIDPERSRTMNAVVGTVDDAFKNAIPGLRDDLIKADIDRSVKHLNKHPDYQVLSELPAPYASRQYVNPEVSMEELIDFWTAGGKYPLPSPWRRPR